VAGVRIFEDKKEHKTRKRIWGKRRKSRL